MGDGGSGLPVPVPAFQVLGLFRSLLREFFLICPEGGELVLPFGTTVQGILGDQFQNGVYGFHADFVQGTVEHALAGSGVALDGAVLAGGGYIRGGEDGVEVCPLFNLAILVTGDGFFDADSSGIGHIQGIDIAALDEGVQAFGGAAVLGVIEAEIPHGFHGGFAGHGVFLDGDHAAETADKVAAGVAVQLAAFSEHLIVFRREAVKVQIIEHCSVVR
ncbi:MAG: hypothetical protein J6S14_15415 [Clostridia bacterium]|nr:hypothetical protein [Clostridia bacterium]